MTISLSKIWNDSLVKIEPSIPQKRNYIYASELGGSMVDRWLKMNGIPFSNPTSARSLRKFEAGNFIEWLVSMILRRAGLLKERQLRAYRDATNNTLAVSGKLDFVAGGQIDPEGSLSDMAAAFELPPFFSKVFDNVITELAGKTYDDCILEIKSCSVMVFDGFLSRKVRPQHSLQATHYSLILGLPAKIVYVCKDDLRMAEFQTPLSEEQVNAYNNDIATFSNYYLSNERPPLESPIIFDTNSYRFYKNWKIAYSNYLTMLYGFKDEAEFDAIVSPKIRSYNYCWNRIVSEKNITKGNMETFEEMKQIIPNIIEYIEPAKLMSNNDPTEL